MKHIISTLSWIAIACIAIVSLSLCPRTNTESLSSPPIPGAAFGPSIDEVVARLGGDVEKSLGE